MHAAAVIIKITYAALQKTESLLWAESAEFIVGEYYREKEQTVEITG